VSVSQRTSENKTKRISININPRKMLQKGENNLGKSSVGRKGWKLHPHLVLLDFVRRTEHLPCNKESRHCGIEIIAGNITFAKVTGQQLACIQKKKMQKQIYARENK